MCMMLYNNDQVRHNFEKKVFRRFHLSLLGKAKWYLGINFIPSKKDIPITEDQTKHIKSRLSNLNHKLFASNNIKIT